MVSVTSQHDDSTSHILGRWIDALSSKDLRLLTGASDSVAACFPTRIWRPISRIALNRKRRSGQAKALGFGPPLAKLEASTFGRSGLRVFCGRITEKCISHRGHQRARSALWVLVGSFLTVYAAALAPHMRTSRTGRACTDPDRTGEPG